MLNKNVFVRCSVCAALMSCSEAKADTVILGPATYSGSTTNSNGKGEHIFAGRTDDGYIRRAALAFDLSSIRSGSTVTGVSLTLFMSRSRASAVNVSLHGATAGWVMALRTQKFENFIGKYPYHCHILEHEDNEMMRQFEVVLPPRFTEIRRAGLDIALTFRPSLNCRHFLERRNDFAAGAWTTFATNILGGATNLMAIDPIEAGQPQRVYRIGLTPQ